MSVPQKLAAVPIWVRLSISLIVVAGLVIVGNRLLTGLMEHFNLNDTLSSGPMTLMLILSLILYVVLLAIPFVPGAEVGMILLTLGGAKLAPIVYLATVTSLCLAFLIGRLVPERLITATLAWVGLHRAAELSARFEAVPPEARARTLQRLLSGRALPAALKYRYLTLALAINLPGNMLIGGGGGIAMTAGLSRLFNPLPFIATVLLAVLPVPLFILLYGKFWPI